MRIRTEVKEELKHLYNELREAQEIWVAATDEQAKLVGVKGGLVRKHIRLFATGKLAAALEEQQLMLNL